MAKNTKPVTPASPAELAGGAAVGDKRAKWLFLGLFLLYMFDYIDREIVSSIIPFLKADLGITDTQAGSLISAVYWSIVVFRIPGLDHRRSLEP